MSLFHAGLQPAIDSNGDPISGATWNFYATGTTTPVAVYADSDLSTSLGAVVTANSVGRFADIYLDDVIYRAILKDAGGSSLADIDPVSSTVDAALIGIAQGGTVQGFINAQSVTTRTELKALDVTENSAAVLLEVGREGRFYLRAGATPTDTLEGVYVDSDTANFYWEREWDGINAYPEWFGATPIVDSWAAITAALSVGSNVWLRKVDYVTTATLVIPPYKMLAGAGPYYEGVDTATRILAVGQISPIIRMGVSVYPGTLNDCPHGGTLSDLFVSRNTAPTLASDNVGVSVDYSRYAGIYRVNSDTSINSFRIDGAVSPTLIDCRAKRSIVSTTNAAGANDKWRGFDMPGASTLGAAGANASLRLIRCSSELNVTITDSAGFSLAGRMTDTFVDDPETVGAAYGLLITGDKAGSPATGTNFHVRITNPAFDQSTVRGVYITDINKWGCITISNPYVGPTSGEAIRAGNCDGAIVVLQGQISMSGSTSAAVIFDTCRSPTLDQTLILDCRTQAAVLNAVVGGYVAPKTENVTQTLAAAIQIIANCTDVTCEPYCDGDASTVGIGIQSLAATNDYNEFRKTGLKRSVVGTKVSVSGGEANTLSYGVP